MNPLKPLIAEIKDIKFETEDVRTYTLFTAAAFLPAPGQFNMLGYPGAGEAPISLSSISKNGFFDHTIRTAGRVTGFIERLKIGDDIFFRGPYGNGWPIKETEGKDLILIAGGVGLAPIRPVIQWILKNRNSFGDVSLICGARNEKNMLFQSEFREWGKKIGLYLTVDEVIDAGEWKHNTGLVTELLDKVKIKPERTSAFICGPEIMMRFISIGLLMRRIPQSEIYVSLERRMKCGIAQCGHCQHFGLFVCKDGPVFSYKDVRGLPDGTL